MKSSELSKVVSTAIKKALKEAIDLGEMDPSDRDELAYAQHLDDLGQGPHDASAIDPTSEITTILMRVCNRVLASKETEIDPEVLAQAVEHIEQADSILADAGLSSGDEIEEGFGGIGSADRDSVTMNIQTQCREILYNVKGSSLPTGGLKAIAANLEHLANKLKDS